MQDIDKVVINFDDGQMVLMNIVLGLLMFGVALELKVKDFKNVVKYPKPVLVGITSQLLLLPLFTIALIKVVNPTITIALGLILVASCPGGNISNYFVHRSQGNAALSITLTSIVTVAAVFITPISFFLWTKFMIIPQEISSKITVNFLSMMKIIFQLVIIPLSIGMFINHRYPNLQKVLVKPMKILSILFLLGIIGFGIKDNIGVAIDYLDTIFILVLCHNGIAYLMGYRWSKLFRLGRREARAISMETGIQNGGLALLIILNYFQGLGGMAVVAAWWGIWDIFSGFALSSYWLNKSAKAGQNV